jgi:uncharacterized membrane protein SpoIIM required for sporulation
MAEALLDFVARRRPEWDALGTLLARQRAGQLHLEDVSALDRLYRHAATDLAHARAHYGGTDVVRFLNQLCGDAYAAIYRPPRERLTALRTFFARELPRAVRAERRYVAASAFFLVLGGGLGALLVALAPEAARLVVPAGIREAIHEHRMWTDPFVGVAPGAFSSAIATNNLTVTIAAFALGVTLGIGTTFLLLLNGLSIGAVIALCLRAGMGYALFSFIGGHGPVELSVIVISGAAGLIVGHALIDPGDLPRGVHLQQRAREGVRLVLGCAPFLALIALIEGFVSPGQVFPGAVKLSLGLALGAGFWSYLWLAGRTDLPAEEATSARGVRLAR